MAIMMVTGDDGNDGDGPDGGGGNDDGVVQVGMVMLMVVTVVVTQVMKMVAVTPAEGHEFGQCLQYTLENPSNKNEILFGTGCC